MKLLHSIPLKKKEKQRRAREMKIKREKKRRICAPSYLDNNVKKYVVYALMHIISIDLYILDTIRIYNLCDNLNRAIFENKPYSPSE